MFCIEKNFCNLRESFLLPSTAKLVLYPSVLVRLPVDGCVGEETPVG